MASTSSSASEGKEKSIRSSPPPYYPQQYEMVTIPLSSPSSTNPQLPAKIYSLPCPYLDIYRRRKLKTYIICLLIVAVVIVASVVTGFKVHAIVAEHEHQAVNTDSAVAASKASSALPLPEVPSLTKSNSGAVTLAASTVTSTQTLIQISMVTQTVIAATKTTAGIPNDSLSISRSDMVAMTVESSTSGVGLSSVLSALGANTVVITKIITTSTASI